MHGMTDVHAFSADQVRRLTGLSERQLRYWDSTGFFSPGLGPAALRTPYARAYSFRDVVGLRALAEMRKLHHVPLQELRKVGKVLSEHCNAPWSQLTFYIVGKTVYYQEDRDAAVKSTRPGHQNIMQFALVRVEGDVRKALDLLRQRTSKQIGNVTQRKYVAGNQPVLDGTRVPTLAIWEFYAAGYRRESIVAEYPQLSLQDVDAAIAFGRSRLPSAS